MNERLITEFQKEEILLALKDIPSIKIPGHDTIPPELFVELWETMGEDYKELLSESLNSGSLDEAIKFEVTSLIPKGRT
jgi:hypothetical protein